MSTPGAKAFDALLNQLLELPESERGAWVDNLPEAAAEHQPRLRKMMAWLAQQDSKSFMTLPKASLATTATGLVALPNQIGPYLVLEQLGRGGMASVWKARDLRTTGASHPRFVALKVVQQRKPQAGFAQRLAREQQLLAALDHPNIVRFVEAIRCDDGLLCLVLEYIDGVTLDQFCATHTLSLARRFALAVQIADALAHAHARSIAHCDLKPSNVLVTARGEAHLLDFGIAKLMAEIAPDQPQLSASFGRPLTPEYAAPEQLLGADPSFASDIYSLGMLVYELATGVRPFAYAAKQLRALRHEVEHTTPRPPSEVAPDQLTSVLLAGRIDATLLCALQKDPTARHTSMRELAEELAAHAHMLAGR